MTSEGALCPICCLPIEIQGDVPLYGVPVCQPCLQRFAARRQLAGILDFVGVVMLLAMAEDLINPAGTRFARHGAAAWSPILLGAVLLYGLKDGFRGYSPAKWVMGVRVVDVNSGEPIGLLRSVKRNLPPMFALALPSAML